MLKVILTFLGLMILTSKAHAVTALVPVIAGFFGGGALASLIVGLALSYIVGKVFAPEKEEREEPADQGVKQRIPTDPRNKLPIVYGTKSVAGQITYASISGNNQKMAFIIALAEGPVTSINTVKWEDKTLSFSGNINTGLRSVSNASPDAGGSDDFLNSGRFKVRVFPTGGRCPEMEGFDSDWNSSGSSRTMPNTAYAYCELTYDQEKRVTSLSNRLQFTITGRTVKPLTSTTTATSYAAASEATSSNPAEILVDYLTNTRYGAGVPLNAIDFATFNSHADFCDFNAQYTKTAADGGGTANATRYTTNGSINTNQDVDQNVTDLTIGNSAMLTWNYGQFGIVSDTTKDSVFSFSEDNIFGKLQISKLGFDNKLNEITAKFDSLKSKEQEEQVIRSVPASNRNDNEPVLERTVTLPMTNNAIEARRVSAIYLNKSRQDLMINFTTSLEASGVESGDVISLTHETPGFTNKLFIVHSVEEKVVNNIIGLELTAQEYAADVYNDTINDEDGAPNTRLPNPFAAPVIENLVVAEDISTAEPNLVATWDDNVNSPLVSQYELDYTPTVNTTQLASVGATQLVVNSTAGFPTSGILIVSTTGETDEEFVYDSLVTGNIFRSIATGSGGSGDSIETERPASTTSLTLREKTFKTVSGGQRYEISPLVALVSYIVGVTPISTLGNRGATLTATATTGVARQIGTPGADGNQGVDGDFERAVYLNSNQVPPLPPAGNDYNSIEDTLTPPTGGWAEQPTESDTIQRWVSRATVNTANESAETASLDFSTISDSGIKTEEQGAVREAGYFDFQGNPGTTVQELPEISIFSTNGTTGSTQIIDATAETTTLQMVVVPDSNGSLAMGTDAGTVNPSQETTVITVSGTANNSSPRHFSDISGSPTRIGFNADTVSGTSVISFHRGQAYDGSVFVWAGLNGSQNEGRIETSTDGGLSVSSTTNTTEEIEDLVWGETSGGTGYFVTCGDGGQINYSTDGSSWSSNTAGSSNLKSITYVDGMWATVGDSGSIRVSSDPSGTWSNRTFAGGSPNWDQVVGGFDNAGDAIFVATGAGGFIGADTHNGSGPWSNQSVSGSTGDIRQLAYNETDQQWAACIEGGSQAARGILISTDGISGWSFSGGQAAFASENPRGIACGNGDIVCVSRAGIAYSSDGGATPFTSNTDGDSAHAFADPNNIPHVAHFAGGTFFMTNFLFGALTVYAGTTGARLDGNINNQKSNIAWGGGGTPTAWTYIDDRIDNTDGSSNALIGSCRFTENIGGRNANGFTLETSSDCSTSHNSAGNFARCNRIVAGRGVTGVRDTYYEFDDDQGATDNQFFGLLSASDSTEIATQIAAQVSESPSLVTASAAGSVVTLSHIAPGNQINLRFVNPSNKFQNEQDTIYNSASGKVGDADVTSFVITDGEAAITTLKTAFRLIPSAPNHSSIPNPFIGTFGNAVSLETAMNTLRNLFVNGTISGYDDTTPTAVTLSTTTVADDTASFTVTSDSLDQEVDLQFEITEDGTNLAVEALDITESLSVVDGTPASTTGGPTSFSISVAGTVRVTGTFSDSPLDANAQAQAIENAIVTAGGITSPQVNVTHDDNTSVIRFEAANAGDIDPDITLTYTYQTDDGVSDNPPTLDFNQDGVAGELPDQIELDFKGISDPAQVLLQLTTTMGLTSSEALDLSLTDILGATIPGISLYNGDLAASTTLVGDIDAGDIRSFVSIADTSGFPTSGNVTVGASDVFAYNSMTPGSSEFGVCTLNGTVISHTDEDSCLAETTAVAGDSLVFTPHIRLNGSDTTFTVGASSGSNVTTTTVRYPTPSLVNTRRRVAWEYNAPRSNGRIQTLTVTGTATTGNVILQIDGTTVTAPVVAANTEIQNAAAIRSAIGSTLTNSDEVSVVAGDLGNVIRLVGLQSAGAWALVRTAQSGLTLTPAIPQEFTNSTIVGSANGVRERAGTAGGNFLVIDDANPTEVLGLNQIIIGELTEATITILGQTYTIQYQGLENANDGGAFTPFVSADATEITNQLEDFLNRQP